MQCQLLRSIIGSLSILPLSRVILMAASTAMAVVIE
jgi:hypothetical protein